MISNNPRIITIKSKYGISVFLTNCISCGLGGALTTPKYGKYGKHGVSVFWLIEIRNFSIWLSAKLWFSRVLGYAFSCGVQVLCIKVLSDFKGLWNWDVLWHSRGTGRSSQKTWISKGATWKNKKLMDKSPRPSIEMMVSAPKKKQSLKTNHPFNAPLSVDLINPSPLYPFASSEQGAIIWGPTF